MDGDWTLALIVAASSTIGTFVGMLIPMMIVAYKNGALCARQAAHEERCKSECERQTREHSRLFQRTDEHGEAIGKLQSEVQSIDRRVTVIEGDPGRGASRNNRSGK